MQKYLTPEMKAHFEAIMQKINKKPRSGGFEEKLINFLGMELTQVLAFGLVNKYKKTLNIELLDDLNHVDQKEFTLLLCRHVFERSKTSQEIDWIISEFFKT